MQHQYFSFDDCPSEGYTLIKWRKEWEFVYGEEYWIEKPSGKEDERGWYLWWHGYCCDCREKFSQRTKLRGYIQRRCEECSDYERKKRVEVGYARYAAMKKAETELEELLRKEQIASLPEAPEHWNRAFKSELNFWKKHFIADECTYTQAESKIMDIKELAEGENGKPMDIGRIRLTGFNKRPNVERHLFERKGKLWNAYQTYLDYISEENAEGRMTDHKFKQTVEYYSSFFKTKCLEDIL